MQHAKWSHFIAQLAQLRRQRQAGMALLRGNAPHDATVASLESEAQPHLACPNCHSSHAHRHGHAHRQLARRHPHAGRYPCTERQRLSQPPARMAAALSRYA